MGQEKEVKKQELISIDFFVMPIFPQLLLQDKPDTQ